MHDLVMKMYEIMNCTIITIRSYIIQVCICMKCTEVAFPRPYNLQARAADFRDEAYKPTRAQYLYGTSFGVQKTVIEVPILYMRLWRALILFPRSFHLAATS